MKLITSTNLLSSLLLTLSILSQDTSAYSFVGKRALVTGSSGRVGAAIAKELARRGANVLIHYNTKYDVAKYTNQQILDYAAAHPLNNPYPPTNGNTSNNNNNIRPGTCDGIIQCDFNKPGDILQMMRIVDQIWGGQLDILINSAECVTRLASEDDNDRINSFRKTIQVNLNAPFKLSRLAHKRMRQQPEGGVIVNISSNHAASKNLEYMTAYAASKAGLDRMTAGLSSEWSRDRVRVNAVAPTFSLAGERYGAAGAGYGGSSDYGYNTSSSRSSTTSNDGTSWSSSTTSTGQSNGSTTSTSTAATNKLVKGRVATLENIVNSALYLCESEFTTGSVLTVDGSNSRTSMFRPRPLTGSTAATRPKPSTSDNDFSRYDQPNRPNTSSSSSNRPFTSTRPIVGASQNFPSSQNNGYGYGTTQSYSNTNRYGPPNAPVNYRNNQSLPYLNQRSTTAFDDNGSVPQRKMMENYRDGSERFNDYRVNQVRSTNNQRYGGQRFDRNTLQRRPMENFRDGSDRERYQNRSMPQVRDFEPRYYATRPKKRDGQTYSSTRSVSQNFTNGSSSNSNLSRYNPNNNPYTGPPLYGTRPPPRQRERREMNSISRTLYNGESSLPEYSTYPDPPNMRRTRDGYAYPVGRGGGVDNEGLPKLMATRPRPDAKYKQVTRYLNGEPARPLVDPNKSRNPMDGYNRLNGYDEDEPKRYGGTSQPL